MWTDILVELICNLLGESLVRARSGPIVAGVLVAGFGLALLVTSQGSHVWGVFLIGIGVLACWIGWWLHQP